MRIQSHQSPIAITVSIARSCPSWFDVAQHRTGIAANRVFSHARLLFASPESPPAHGLESLEFFAILFPRHHAVRSESLERLELPLARQYPSPQRVQPTKDIQSGSTRLAECRPPKESGSREDSRPCRG